MKLANYNSTPLLKYGDKIRDREGVVRTITRVTESRAYFSKGPGQFGFVKPDHLALSQEECDLLKQGEKRVADVMAEIQAAIDKAEGR